MLQRKHGRKERSDSLSVGSKEPLLKKRLKRLFLEKADIQKFSNLKEEICNEIGLWASLKLMFLDIYSGFYKNIISRFYHDNYFYVDLFAGSGIGKIEDMKDVFVFGSPLIVAKRDFTKMFLCEIDEKKCEILIKRLLNFQQRDKFEIYNTSCNMAVDQIVPKIKGGHSLIFIDPYGMEINWHTMEKVLNVPNADIIFNFQTANMARGIMHGEKLTQTSINFFKDEKELEKVYKEGKLEHSIAERLLELYIHDIESVRATGYKKTIVKKLRIHKDNQFYYDLIFVVRETKSGNPWLLEIEKYTKQIEALDAKDVKNSIPVIKGNQSVLGGRTGQFKLS